MILAPRGHGKSWIIMIRIMYFLVKNFPFGTVLFITSTSKNAKRIYRQVKRIFNYNRRVHEIVHCEDTIESSDNSTKEIWFPRPDIETLDPSFLAVGRGTEVIGGHQDRIFIEDVLQKMSKSQETEENLQEWYDSTIEYIETVDSKTIVTGTRKGKNDLYQYMIDTHEYEQIYRSPAIELNIKEYPEARFPDHDDFVWNNGVIIDLKLPKEWYITLNCPNWDLIKLLKKRFSNYIKFEREMQNNVIPVEGLYFNPGDMQYYDQLPDPAHTTVAIHCDPSHGVSNTSDYTAIVVVGWYKVMNRFYVMEHYLNKSMDYNEIIDQFVYIVNKWKKMGYTVISQSMEKNAAQRWLIDGLKRQPFTVTPIDSRKNKIDRINSLVPGFRQRLYYFNKENPGYDEALNQIANYDCTESTATRKDDFLDAFQGAYEQIGIVLYAKGNNYATA